MENITAATGDKVGTGFINAKKKVWACSLQADFVSPEHKGDLQGELYYHYNVL